MKKRTICFITGARSEYGLLRPLMSAVKEDADLCLQLIVTGSHLSEAYGLSAREISRDGFKMNEKVPILGPDDSLQAMACAMGKCLEGVARALGRLKPDMIVCMGDRYEMLSAASAAMACRIPVVHLSGGEITHGAMDDQIRHAITKLSHLHLVSTHEHRWRVIQMGESPERVFNVGEVGLADIRKLEYLSRLEIEKELAFRFLRKNYLVTYHPVTLEEDYGYRGLGALLTALDHQKDTLTIFTKCNADPAGKRFNRAIEKYVAARPGRTILFDSLGRKRYLSVLRQVDAVVGNSSSGIVEAPSFNVPSVNIGARQEGRARAASVIDCAADSGSIAKALVKACSAAFVRKTSRVKNPYEGKGIGHVVAILKKVSLRGLLQKEFMDIKEACAHRR
ncbi:MAG: UDP-N-acetylglucosamine 2-epimerase (hydrolyzing) [Candidatus Omnitrophica bacterium]|nr:UDP-N-acetylglucosamine 2-epimerase (hydrolyzing) [Candidatus Omnitrophota bacterium]